MSRPTEPTTKILTRHQFTKSFRPLKASALLLIAGNLVASDPAGLSVRIKPPHVLPGDTVDIVISGQKDSDRPTCLFDNHPVPSYKISESKWKVLIGIPADLAPGPHALQMGQTGHPTQSVSLEVRRKSFPFESITFTPEKKKLLSAGDVEGREIHQLLGIETPSRLWKGAFHRPVPGRLIAPYGARRAYEDFHRGVDLECAAGRLIKSPEAGRVILTKKFQLHGNTVLIDHGQGVMSIYLHLSEFLIKSGQVVRKNEPIGKVGSSGLSTAPHLHWGVYVHGVPVDPLLWTKRKY